MLGFSVAVHAMTDSFVKCIRDLVGVDCADVSRFCDVPLCGLRGETYGNAPVCKYDLITRTCVHGAHEGFLESSFQVEALWGRRALDLTVRPEPSTRPSVSTERRPISAPLSLSPVQDSFKATRLKQHNSL